MSMLWLWVCVVQELESVQARLVEAEGAKERCFQQEEEMTQFTTQEMAKLRHMVFTGQ